MYGVCEERSEGAGISSHPAVYVTDVRVCKISDTRYNPDEPDKRCVQATTQRHG